MHFEWSKQKKNKPAFDAIEELKNAIELADAIVIGAGSGLSTAAGFQYDGECFDRYFSDFKTKYHFHDMYSGGFYPYSNVTEFWAYWSRYIYINRYMNAPKPVYEHLYKLVEDKDYFVITTNVDHCFQKAGFDRTRLFYTQGDYGLFQCSEPCHQKTYENYDWICRMAEDQGYEIEENGELTLPEGVTPKMEVTENLIPYCPVCNKPMSMNLRADETFVEDEGWYIVAFAYQDFLIRHQNQKILYLELGVGYNTPGIIKYPFWRMTAKNPKAIYACVNFDQVGAPREIEDRSICINADIEKVLEQFCSHYSIDKARKTMK